MRIPRRPPMVCSQLLALLLSLLLAACVDANGEVIPFGFFMDGPDPVVGRCHGLGGRVVMRRVLANPDYLQNLCLFPDGEVCEWSEIVEGICDHEASSLQTGTPPAIMSEIPAPVFPQSTPVYTPFTLATLISQAPLIVIGAVGPAERFFTFAGYAEDGSLIPPGESGSPPGIPATDFQLIVEQTLRGDGRVASADTVILRAVPLNQAELETLEALGLGFEGKRALYLLRANPDGESYGLPLGSFSVMEIENGVLYPDDGGRSPLYTEAFSGPVTLDEFIAAVRDVESGKPEVAETVPVDPWSTPRALAPEFTAPEATPAATLIVPGFASGVPVPATVDALIEKAPLIVIGQIDSVYRYLSFAGYADDGTLIAPGEGGATPAMPATDFRLVVEQVLRGDGGMARNEPVILRVAPLSESDLSTMMILGYGFRGVRTVFLLTPNPDGETYGFALNPYSKLKIEGDYLVPEDGSGVPLQFPGDAQPITLQEFVSAVQNASGLPSSSTPVADPLIGPLPTPAAAPDAPSPLAPGGAVSAPVPTSLAAFIQGAPLIFVGQVGPVERHFDFAGYATDGSLAVPGENGAPPALPATDFRLVVEQPLRDDGRISGGEPILLRMAPLSETDVQALDRLGLGLEGKRYLFVLQRNPDGQSYGPGYGPLSLLTIDGDRLLLSDGASTPLHFPGDAEPVTLEEFVAAVQGQE